MSHNVPRLSEVCRWRAFLQSKNRDRGKFPEGQGRATAQPAADEPVLGDVHFIYSAISFFNNFTVSLKASGNSAPGCPALAKYKPFKVFFSMLR